MNSLSRWMSLSVTALAVTVLTAPAQAQLFPAFGGVEARGGLVGPEQAGVGVGASVELDLGYLGSPILRPIAGVTGFRADVDRSDSQGNAVDGTMTALGARAGFRLDPFGQAAISPFLTGTLTGHSVNTDGVNDASTRDLLNGFYVGASLGGGASYALDLQGRTRVTGEVRRVFTNNVGHWAAEVGVRFMPLGNRSYDLDDPWRRPTQRW